MPSLKPRRPSPRPLPSSGSFLPPKRTRTTTARTMRCVGVKSSPIVILPAAGIYTRRPAPTIVAHALSNDRYGEEEQADVGQTLYLGYTEHVGEDDAEEDDWNAEEYCSRIDWDAGGCGADGGSRTGNGPGEQQDWPFGS